MGFFTDKHGYASPGKIISLVVATIIGGSFLSCKGCNNIEYGAGERTGVINKVSNKGYIWKTWEGQMALEGLVAGKSVGANVWDFSIDEQRRNGEDPDSLSTLLRHYMQSGQRVKIKYNEAGAPWMSRGSTSYYIQSVEPAERAEDK